ncbi:dynamin family protein [Aeromonas caviae]|uniref:dynamin family protein n=1 Tax=Aeromonas caviae TaxID=648 RepID=UPI001BCB59A4|nr:dynamin family protein [Aeromonas caviae]
MADHLCTQLNEQAVRERYTLLSQACESTAGTGNQQLEEQLQALEQIIERDLPALARKGSPDNITDLLQALRLEMTRFREFCEYPALPSKVVVGLGGSFSAGKSSLINALIGDRKCLVTEVDPTTSLPTYLVQAKSEQTEVHAINLFNRVVSLSHEQFRTLTHEEKSRYGSQVSSLLKSVVVAHPALPWGNLALLDTPGYSKADQVGSERTDANLARAQLNSAQFIVWLVPADKGTITEEDIAFLGTLDRAIPKLVVISRADKHPAEEIEKIVTLVHDTLAKRGLSVLDVIPFSTRPRSNYSAEPLLDYFAQWNKARRELGFAKQFKRQFMGYQRFIDEERQEALRLLGRFNRILALNDDGNVQADIDSVQRKCKGELAQLELLAQMLAELQGRFFTELKTIGEQVGIPLPEPDVISLLDLSSINLSGMLGQLAEEWGVSATECNPAIWLPLTSDLSLTNLPKLLRRDISSYPAIWLPLTYDLPLTNLPKLLRRDILSYPFLQVLQA